MPAPRGPTAIRSPQLSLLSDVREVDIPIERVRDAAGFEPSYSMNRQALVPREQREAGVWEIVGTRSGGWRRLICGDSGGHATARVVGESGQDVGG